MRRIALVNLKGGSSKSTSATALAVGLARRGRRVLFVDADQSGNGGFLLAGEQGTAPPTLADVLTRSAAVEDAIRPSRVEGLDLLPADSTLGGVNVRLAQEVARDTRLRSALASIEDEYDAAIVDTGPSFTTVLANVLVWAHEVIIPADPGIFAMIGLVELQTTMAEVREAYGNADLRIAGLLLTRVSRNNVHRDVEAELRSRFGPVVFKTTVPLSSRVEAAHTNARTVTEFDPKSPAALAYAAFVDEVDHGRDAKDRGGKRTKRGSGEGASAA